MAEKNKEFRNEGTPSRSLLKGLSILVFTSSKNIPMKVCNKLIMLHCTY